jgi:hypothetical protein
LKILGEVWAKRACDEANEKELTTCAQKGGLEFEKEVAVVQNRGLVPQPATSDRLPAAAHSLTDCGPALFLQFFN